MRNGLLAVAITAKWREAGNVISKCQPAISVSSWRHGYQKIAAKWPLPKIMAVMKLSIKRLKRNEEENNENEGEMAAAYQRGG